VYLWLRVQPNLIRNPALVQLWFRRIPHPRENRKRKITAGKVAVYSQHGTCGRHYSSKNNININYEKKTNTKLMEHRDCLLFPHPRENRMREVNPKVAVYSEHRTRGGHYSSKKNINTNYKKKQNMKLLLDIRSLCTESTEPAEDIQSVIVVIIIRRRNRILKYRSIATASSSRTPERIECSDR